MSRRPQSRSPGAVGPPARPGPSGTRARRGPIRETPGRARGRPCLSSLRNGPLERPGSRGCVCARARPRAPGPPDVALGAGVPAAGPAGWSAVAAPRPWGVHGGRRGRRTSPPRSPTPRRVGLLRVHREPAAGSGRGSADCRREEPSPVTHEGAPRGSFRERVGSRGRPGLAEVAAAPRLAPLLRPCCSPGAPARADLRASPSRDSFPVSGAGAALCPHPESWKPAALRGGVRTLPRSGL